MTCCGQEVVRGVSFPKMATNWPTQFLDVSPRTLCLYDLFKPISDGCSNLECQAPGNQASELPFFFFYGSNNNIERSSPFTVF